MVEVIRVRMHKGRMNLVTQNQVKRRGGACLGK
jgi:hypothetical protein